MHVVTLVVWTLQYTVSIEISRLLSLDLAPSHLTAILRDSFVDGNISEYALEASGSKSRATEGQVSFRLAVIALL